MPASILSAFLLFAFIAAFTPGPNTILALSMGTRHGFRGCFRLLAGICCGFFCVMLLCGILTFSVSTLSASCIRIMKYVGCLYIVWLAWKVFSARTEQENASSADAGFTAAFLLQFLNIKVVIYGMTAYSAFLLPWYDAAVTLPAGALVLTLIGSAGTVAWAGAGSVLRHFFLRHARLANTLMAVLLLGCALSLLCEGQ